ncbi:hypothetical protein ACLOJK_016562 [Asimina triloba]
MAKSNSNRGPAAPHGAVGGGEKVEGRRPKSMQCKKRQYKGVRMRSWGSWVSEIRAPNQKTRIWLGSYATPEAAARAYDAALLCLKGSSANLNFPLESSYLQLPDTVLSPKSIQRVAAAAAAAANVAAPPSPASPSLSSTQAPSPSLSSTPSTPSSTSLWLSSASSSYQDEIFAPSQTSQSVWNDFGDFQSPKSAEPMLSVCATSAPMQHPTVEYCEDEGDFRLWSF